MAANKPETLLKNKVLNKDDINMIRKIAFNKKSPRDEKKVS